MKHATAGLAVALVTVVLTPILATAQSQVTVSGRVVADATGDPIPNARIAVTPPVPGAPVVLSDGNGRFSISIPAGQAKVVASKSGYAKSEMAGRVTFDTYNNSKSPAPSAIEIAPRPVDFNLAHQPRERGRSGGLALRAEGHQRPAASGADAHAAGLGVERDSREWHRRDRSPTGIRPAESVADRRRGGADGSDQHDHGHSRRQ
jgi:hypothetical protein